MQEIKDRKFPNERDLYATRNLHLINCIFDGEEDGESALKEAADVRLDDCYMNLRYPLWHDRGVVLNGVTMTEKCRAALWYSDGIRITDSKLHGIKALRECSDILIRDSDVVSPEFGWRSRDITMEKTKLQSEYLFLQARDIRLKNVEFHGKYSFQYVENMIIEDSVLDTKDAFWHSKNVTVRNSVVRGEYLAWYSENLRLEHCKIIGTQPLCYCKGLVLADCETENADLAFEYSEVDATLRGHIVSVKNPLSGRIAAEEIGEIILTKDSKYPCECKIEII